MTDVAILHDFRNASRTQTRNDAAKTARRDVPLFSAVPRSKWWAVKAIGPDGQVALVGQFDDRLSALGAALLMSVQAGGRAIP